MSDIVRRPPPTLSLDRREVLTLGVGAFVVATIPAARAAPEPRRSSAAASPSWARIADVAVVHDDRAAAHAAIGAAFESPARDRPPDVALPRGLRRRPRQPDARRRGRARRRPRRPTSWRARSTALARPTAASTRAWAAPSELWDVDRRTQPAAGRRACGALAGRDLWRRSSSTSARAAARRALATRTSAIDLGGIAKGYGVDRAVTALRAHGVEHGLVNVGGDLYALGHRADGEPWRVGVRDAHDPDALTQTLGDRDEAVATSGDYRQFFDHAGRRYHHLLDPRTGAPHEAGPQRHSWRPRAWRRTPRPPRSVSAADAARAVFARVAPDVRIVSSA